MEHDHPPFKDRRDAGRQLAAALMHLKESEPIVLALPPGGIPVAYEVAQALHAPLDTLAVRKPGAPNAPEGGRHQRVLNDSVCSVAARAPIDIQGRNVIVVDDGIANGSRMKAALQALAEGGPERLVFAVPVASRQVLDDLCDAADDGVCLLAPERFREVSLYYRDFRPSTDDEVSDLLKEASSQPTEQEKTMQTISEIMTRDVAVVSPQDDIRRAAQMLRDWNVGALPVCDGQRLVGMITDRDIAIRATPSGQPPEQLRVADVMTDEVRWCYEDQTVGEVLQQMGDEQIRRIPVVDRNKQLVGIVSLGDIATRDETTDTDATLEDISTPSEPIRPSADEARLRREPGQPG